MKPVKQLFQTPGRIYAGAGCVSTVAEAVCFGTRCLLVTGRSSTRASGAVHAVTESLTGAGAEVTLFDNVEQDPGVTTVDAIRSRIHETHAEFLVGLGGGSAMDAAKAAAGLAAETAPTSAFLLEQRQARAGLPIVAIPTTSGTGAEATPNAVICDPSAKVKASLRNGHFLPSMAIVDPLLTFSCPARITAYSGMDAITQAIESFVSIHAGPLSDAFAFEALRLLWGNVERAFADGADLSAREACSYGSLMAGISLANARLGAVHGIAHPLGVRYGIPHGLICAALLPEVTRTNLPCSAAKYGRLSALVAGDLVGELDALNVRLGIYDDLATYRILKADFALIADESMSSGSLKANPKTFTREDVVGVLEALTSRAGGNQ